MKSGTILFHGSDLAMYGEPSFTIARTPEPAPPSRPTHYRLSISVNVELCADMPATTWARVRALHAILNSTAEGSLTVRNENGADTHWLVSPGENNLPEVIERGAGTMKIEFSGIEKIDPLPVTITLDPLDGSMPTLLERPSGWSEVVRTDRPDERLNNRSQVITTITFTSRTLYADMGTDSTARAEELLSRAAAIRALAGKETRLQHGGLDEIVRLESISATPSESWEYLDVQAQCSWIALPGDTEAEVQYQASTQEDPATGQIRTSVRGNIEAPDRATAEAKADAILAAYHTPVRRVTSYRKSDGLLDGEDAGMTPDWTGMEFSIELVEGSDQTRYTLKVDTTEGSGGRRVRYSGSAWGADYATIQATIATAAENKHPVLLSSQVTLEYATDQDGSLKLDSANFSYEYAAATEAIYATVTTADSDGSFSERTRTISGTVSAPDQSTAIAWARALIPPGKCLRADDERIAEAMHKPLPGVQGSELTSVSFNYSWFIAHNHAAMTYVDASNPDYTRMLNRRNVSGTVRATDRTAADAALTTLLANLKLAAKLPSTTSHSERRERCGDGADPQIYRDYMTALDFSYTYETKLTGVVGHDIIEASWSIERIGMVDHRPMVEIPMAKPVMQPKFGYNIGRLTASGSVKARQQATARTWGVEKRSKVMSISGINGAEDPPKERMTATLVPFADEDVAAYEFNFTYSFRYRDGLTGTWPAALNV